MYACDGGALAVDREVAEGKDELGRVDEPGDEGCVLGCDFETAEDGVGGCAPKLLDYSCGSDRGAEEEGEAGYCHS